MNENGAFNEIVDRYDGLSYFHWWTEAMNLSILL